jgi:hypothetical protein
MGHKLVIYKLLANFEMNRTNSGQAINPSQIHETKLTDCIQINYIRLSLNLQLRV